MAKPNQPKDIKPKSESDGGSKGKDSSSKSGGSAGIIINIISTVIICSVFLVVNYIMLKDINKHNAEEQTEVSEVVEEESEAVQHGIIIDLGEFTMNLSDVSPRAYLKAEVAIEVSSIDSDPKPDAQPEKASGGHGHGGGAPAPDPKELLEQAMQQFKPAIRDSIITVLSSKSSEELRTTTGKELAKEQIAEHVNAIFGGEREVLRVSFGQFIMQVGK